VEGSLNSFEILVLAGSNRITALLDLNEKIFFAFENEKVGYLRIELPFPLVKRL